MSVANKVKAAMKIKGKDHSGLASFLGISNQALSNKFYRDSFSMSDMIKIAKYLECDLLLSLDETQTLAFTDEDI